MNFRPTEPQRLLVAVAREMLERRCPLERAQALALEPMGFADDLWKEMAGLGWPGLLVPTALGGSEGTLLDVVLLVEEMGRACLPSPYIQSAVVATSALLAAASPAAARLLPAMATGDRIVTLALMEERVELRPSTVHLRAEIGGTLEGRKLFVKDAHVAHHLIVVGRGAGGINLVLVPTDARGVRLSPLDAMSGEKLFEVELSAIAVGAESLLGPPGRGWEALAPALEAGALARSAEMVGLAQRILELTVDYAKIRVQSGRPIGSFQAIQHACADLVRHVEGARAIVQYAAWRVTMGLPAATDVAMAKAWTGQACLDVARKAHQIFGAIGYEEEHPLHLLHKRIQAAGVDLGDTTAHLETVAQGIGLR